MVLAVVVAIAAAMALTDRAPQEAEPTFSTIARMMAACLPERHLERLPLDDRIAGRALDIFLDSLDPDHTTLLRADIEPLRAQAAELDDQVQAGHIDFAFDVFNTYKGRLENRVAFVEKLLQQPFDLTKDESWDLDREDAPWPADEQEWDELWRLKIKNLYVARKLVLERQAEQKKARQAQPPAAGDPAKDKEDEAEEDATDADLAPEEFIRKRYKNMLYRIQDSAAEWILERYLTSFAQAYDPHTEYKSPSTTEDWEIGMKLSLVGIGAYLTTEDGAAKVVRLIPGGPAQLDGTLKPGDKIIAVGQGDEKPVDTLHWPLSEVVRLIRGEQGKKVVLVVIPASDPAGATTKKIPLIRDVVKLEEQEAKGDVRDVPDANGKPRQFGVITLPAFYADMRRMAENADDYKSSTRDVMRLLESMKTNDIRGVILDLRNNGGGSLHEAVALTGLFIESGPVVRVKERRRRVGTHVDKDESIAYAGPLLILVNRNTASASEILAAALQDYGRALIVGDSKTHGKGTVQTLIDLSRLRDKDSPEDKLGSLKVTTAGFYRISGRSTQLQGVTPDMVIPSLFDRDDIGEESLDHALECSDIERVHYTPVGDIGGLIPVLRTKSEARRASDPRWAARRKLLAALDERRKEKKISLNIDQRRKMAEEERALLEMQKESDDSEKGQTDLILLEALHILSDFADLAPPAPGAGAPAADNAAPPAPDTAPALEAAPAGPPAP
ncbi:MAG: carboxy terminal-processing peptidase [Kiritimatiellae bacterium]|nr:carboxy terminal-processing peptidase [Kiritimatiellia bacterium]